MTRRRVILVGLSGVLVVGLLVGLWFWCYLSLQGSVPVRELVAAADAAMERTRRRGSTRWDERLPPVLEELAAARDRVREAASRRLSGEEGCGDLPEDDAQACRAALAGASEPIRAFEELFRLTPEVRRDLERRAPLLLRSGSPGGWLDFSQRTYPLMLVPAWEVRRRLEAGDLADAARLARAVRVAGRVLEHGLAEGHRLVHTSRGSGLVHQAYQLQAEVLLRGEPAVAAEAAVLAPPREPPPLLPMRWFLEGEREYSLHLAAAAARRTGLRGRFLALVHGRPTARVEELYRDLVDASSRLDRASLAAYRDRWERFPGPWGNPVARLAVPRLGEAFLGRRGLPLTLARLLPALPAYRRLRARGPVTPVAFGGIPGLPEDLLGPGRVRLEVLADGPAVVMGTPADTGAAVDEPVVVLRLPAPGPPGAGGNIPPGRP